MKVLPYLMDRSGPWVEAKMRRSTGSQTEDSYAEAEQLASSRGADAPFVYSDVRIKDRAIKIKALESSAAVAALRKRIARLSHKD